MVDFVKWQAGLCLLLAILILIPGIFVYQDYVSNPEFMFLFYSYIGTALLFFALSFFFIIIYLRRDRGLAKDLHMSMNEARNYMHEHVIDIQYPVLGRAKWVAFVFFSWIILCSVYLVSAILKSNIAGSWFIGFNVYNVVMFISVIIGIYFFWQMNPNGYIILWGVCIYNIFRIISEHRFVELLVWLYPVISLLVIRKYFTFTSQR